MYERTPKEVVRLMNDISDHEGRISVFACGSGDLLAPIAGDLVSERRDRIVSHITSIRLTDKDVDQIDRARQMLGDSLFPFSVLSETRDIFDQTTPYSDQRVLVHVPKSASPVTTHPPWLDVYGLMHNLNPNIPPTNFYNWLMVSRYHLANNGQAVVLADDVLSFSSENPTDRFIIW